MSKCEHNKRDYCQFCDQFEQKAYKWKQLQRRLDATVYTKCMSRDVTTFDLDSNAIIVFKLAIDNVVGTMPRGR